MGNIQDAANYKSPIQLAAEAPPKKKKEIKREEPSLSLLESLVSPIDRGLQFLDRTHSAANAGINEFGRQVEGTFARTPTPSQLQKQGAPLGETTTRPLMENLTGIYDAIKAGSRASTQAFKENRKEGVRIASQGVSHNAGTTEKLIRRAFDLSIDVQTDPQALALGLGLGVGVKGIKAGTQAARAIPAVQRALTKANNLVDPLAKSAMNSEVGAIVTKVLGLVGAGPHQAIKSNVIRPNELVIARATRPIQEVLTEVEREILRLRKTQFGDAIDNYAYNTGGEDPVKKLIRKTVEERLASHSPQTGIYPLPFNQLTTMQKGMLVKHLNNPYGVSPTWLLDQADKVIASIKNTESNLMRAGVRARVNKPIIDEEKWLDTMFGEKGLAGQAKNKRGIYNPVKGTVPQKMFEAGVRNFVNKISKDRELVKPMSAAGADHGWVEIEHGGLLGKKLGGMQIPEPLEAMLRVELSRAGKGAGGEAKSWYIRNKDWIEWVEKNVVGTVKKGLVAATSTQNANLFSNQQVASMGLKAEGIDPEKMSSKVVMDAYKDVIAMNRGKKTATDIQLIRNYSKSFDATEAGSNYWYGQPRPGMAGEIIGRGQKFGYREPTIGEAAGKLYPPNAIVDFQGTSEQAFKLAMYRTYVANGKSPREAARLVEKYLFDYSDRGVLLEIADKFGFYPFATYPTKALGLLMDTVVNHPELLAKFPRLQELKNVGYEKTLKNVDPRYNGPLTIPYGDPEDKTTFDAQRFFPLGTQVQGLNSMLQGGDPLASTLNAIGIGRPGDTTLSAITNAPLASRAYLISQGIDPNSQAGKPKSLLQPGQPASDLSQIQVAKMLENFGPSQLVGRGAIAERNLSEGKTTTDYPFQKPKTREEKILQYELGVRTGANKSATEARKTPELKSEAKARASVSVKDFVRKAKDIAEKSGSNPRQDDAAKFNDIGQTKKEIQDAIMRLKSLPISGRVSVRGTLTDEGKKDIQNQAYYIYALKVRIKQLKEDLK